MFQKIKSWFSDSIDKSDYVKTKSKLEVMNLRFEALEKNLNGRIDAFYKRYDEHVLDLKKHYDDHFYQVQSRIDASNEKDEERSLKKIERDEKFLKRTHKHQDEVLATVQEENKAIGRIAEVLEKHFCSVYRGPLKIEIDDLKKEE